MPVRSGLAFLGTILGKFISQMCNHFTSFRIIATLGEDYLMAFTSLMKSPLGRVILNPSLSP